MSETSISQGHLFTIAERFLLLSVSLGEKGATDRVQIALRQYRTGVFKLVVVGEIKKGKSSFINALLGVPDLLPTMSDVATSTVFKIMDGSKKVYKAFFLPDDPNRPIETAKAPVDLDLEGVMQYGIESGNPDNHKMVDFIGVQLPHPWLKSGMFIVDTPGLGGLFRHHADITWRYVPDADAIFFILDSVDAVISKVEVDYLQRLQKLSPYIFFVQTKIDQVLPDRWQAWRERNLSIISQKLSIPQDRIVYFPVSAKLKNLADKAKSPPFLNESGFIPLVHFVQETLVKGKEQRFAQRLLSCLTAEADSLRKTLTGNWQILTTETKEEMDTLEHAYASEKTSYERWRSTEFLRALRDFNDASADLKRNALDEIQTALDPSPNGALILPILESLRSEKADAENITSSLKDIQSVCIQKCSERIFAIQGRYNDAMKDLISLTSKKTGASLQTLTGFETLTKGPAVPLADSLDMHVSWFEKTRSTFFGGTAGAGIATLIVGIFFPPAGAGVAVASIAGALVGAFYTRRDAHAKESVQAIGKVTTLLVDVVRIAQKHALQQFQNTATGFERAARDNFENAAVETQHRLDAKLASIADARKRLREDNRTRAAHLAKTIEKVNSILGDLEKLMGRGSSPAA